MVKTIVRAMRRSGSYIDHLNRTNPNIMVFIKYGVLYEVVMNIYKPFAVKYLERVGGTSSDISLFYALPGLAAACSLLPGAMLLSRLAHKKNVTSALFLLSRFCVLLLAAVPFAPAHLRPLVLIAVIGIMNFPEATAQTSLQGFLGKVFNGAERARAIALRNKFGYMTILIVTLVTGCVINYAPKSEAERIVYYQAFFVLAFTVGIAEIFVFRKFRVTDSETAGHVKFGPIMKTIARDKTFRSYLTSTVLFHVAWYAGWPLVAVYQLETLKSSEIWFAMYTVAAGLGSFFTASFWSRRISKRGNPKTLVLACMLTAANMFLYAVAPNPVIMTVISAFAGFSAIGMNITVLNGLLLATPDENRLLYLGTYNTFVNLALFASTMFASVLQFSFGIVGSMLAVFGMRVLAALYVWFSNRRTSAVPAA